MFDWCSIYEKLKERDDATNEEIQEAKKQCQIENPDYFKTKNNLDLIDTKSKLNTYNYEKPGFASNIGQQDTQINNTLPISNETLVSETTTPLVGTIDSPEETLVEPLVSETTTPLVGTIDYPAGTLIDLGGNSVTTSEIIEPIFERSPTNFEVFLMKNEKNKVIFNFSRVFFVPKNEKLPENFVNQLVIEIYRTKERPKKVDEILNDSNLYKQVSAANKNLSFVDYLDVNTDYYFFITPALFGGMKSYADRIRVIKDGELYFLERESIIIEDVKEKKVKIFKKAVFAAPSPTKIEELKNFIKQPDFNLSYPFIIEPKTTFDSSINYPYIKLRVTSKKSNRKFDLNLKYTLLDGKPFTKNTIDLSNEKRKVEFVTQVKYFPENYVSEQIVPPKVEELTSEELLKEFETLYDTLLKIPISYKIKEFLNLLLSEVLNFDNIYEILYSINLTSLNIDYPTDYLTNILNEYQSSKKSPFKFTPTLDVNTYYLEAVDLTNSQIISVFKNNITKEGVDNKRLKYLEDLSLPYTVFQGGQQLPGENNYFQQIIIKEEYKEDEKIRLQALLNRISNFKNYLQGNLLIFSSSEDGLITSTLDNMKKELDKIATILSNQQFKFSPDYETIKQKYDFLNNIYVNILKNKQNGKETLLTTFGSYFLYVQKIEQDLQNYINQIK